MAISFFQGAFLGLIQGVTEWFPISSSGHLVLFQQLFGITKSVALDIVLHLASLIVVLIVLRQDIIKLVKGVYNKDKYFLNYFLWLVIASIPIAFVGFFFNGYIKQTFDNPLVVGISFLFTGLLLLLSKYPLKKTKSLSFLSTLIMGIGQAIAILPGVSRSGTTISLGLLQGRKREDVARFSFLLFIPAIVGASILEISSLRTLTDIPVVLFSAGVTILTGLISLRLLLKIIKNKKFYYFGWYCLVMGLIVLILY
ncbi:MAG: undecaprenyl-diphosphate phosphatase [archaeon]|nr:undecaprenyl-diphosphate phosphatase [archaeon]